MKEILICCFYGTLLLLAAASFIYACGMFPPLFILWVFCSTLPGDPRLHELFQSLISPTKRIAPHTDTEDSSADVHET